jgi:hypothetical protein
MILHEDPKAYAAKVEAAKLGCAECKASVKNPPVGDPFSSGPYRGRYLCSDCWTIVYAEHPEMLADPESVSFCKREAERIKTERAAKAGEVLYEEGPSRAVLTARGTLLLHLEVTPGHLGAEFDPDRYALLLRALKQVDTMNIVGYSLSTLRDNI